MEIFQGKVHFKKIIWRLKGVIGVLGLMRRDEYVGRRESEKLLDE